MKIVISGHLKRHIRVNQGIIINPSKRNLILRPVYRDETVDSPVPARES